MGVHLRLVGFEISDVSKPRQSDASSIKEASQNKYNLFSELRYVKTANFKKY